MKTYIVHQQISIGTPKQAVWEALTNPDLTRKYFFGCRVYSDFVVNHPIVFKKRILGLFPFELKGKIIEINRGSMLRYSLGNSKSVSESEVSIQLQENTGRTLVSVTDDVGRGEGAADRYNRSVKGWDKILRGLKRIAEKMYADKN